MTPAASTTARLWPATVWLMGLTSPSLSKGYDAQTFQGYSAVLNLHLRWEQGQLGWYDPATGRHISRFSDERSRADTAEARAAAAEARADAERQARIAADARVRELEAELRRREMS